MEGRTQLLPGLGSLTLGMPPTLGPCPTLPKDSIWICVGPVPFGLLHGSHFCIKLTSFTLGSLVSFLELFTLTGGGLVVGLECGLGWVSFGILVVQFLRIFMRVAAKGPLCSKLHMEFLCFQAFCFEFWSLTLLDIYCTRVWEVVARLWAFEVFFLKDVVCSGWSAWEQVS